MRPQAISVRCFLTIRIPYIVISALTSVAELMVVDPMMRERPGYLGRVCRALGKAEANIVSIFAPGITIAVVVREDELVQAARAIAEEFGLMA